MKIFEVQREDGTDERKEEATQDSVNEGRSTPNLVPGDIKILRRPQMSPSPPVQEPAPIIDFGEGEQEKRRQRPDAVYQTVRDRYFDPEMPLEEIVEPAPRPEVKNHLSDVKMRETTPSRPPPLMSQILPLQSVPRTQNAPVRSPTNVALPDLSRPPPPNGTPSRFAPNPGFAQNPKRISLLALPMTPPVYVPGYPNFNGFNPIPPQMVMASMYPRPQVNISVTPPPPNPGYQNVVLPVMPQFAYPPPPRYPVANVGSLPHGGQGYQNNGHLLFPGYDFLASSQQNLSFQPSGQGPYVEPYVDFQKRSPY
ncbi:hypothetical protein L596_025811 [Steinernema carpocapsae]|nr:hypothetical protein L596_025811 [Steinernema carpocapsae]